MTCEYCRSSSENSSVLSAAAFPSRCVGRRPQPALFLLQLVLVPLMQRAINRRANARVGCCVNSGPVLWRAVLPPRPGKKARTRSESTACCSSTREYSFDRLRDEHCGTNESQTPLLQ